MMRGTDRRIKLLAAALPDEKWTLPLLKSAGYFLDYVSIHGYYAAGKGDTPYLACMMRTERPEVRIRRTIKILEKAGFGGGKIAIAFDEWNLRGWHHPGLGKFKRDAVMDYAARVSNKVSLANDPTNFVLMQAMGPNVSGVIGSAVVAGILYTLCR